MQGELTQDTFGAMGRPGVQPARKAAALHPVDALRG
jgi:hypothetical protein